MMTVFRFNWAPTKSLDGKAPFEAWYVWYVRKLAVSFFRAHLSVWAM